MTALLTNEFYDHLYKLEERSTPMFSWASTTPDDDPELQWCRKFLDDTFAKQSKKKFHDRMVRCYETGVMGRTTIAHELGMSVHDYRRTLKEYGFEEEEQFLNHFWYGFILQGHEDNSLTFVRNKMCGAKVLNLKTWRSINSVVPSNGKRCLRGHSIYKMYEWKMAYPTFTLYREDVLNNEIIKIA